MSTIVFSSNPIYLFPAAIFISILILAQFEIRSIYGHPNGAPERICESMRPGHGELSLDSKPPFRISLDRWEIRGGGKITITVTSSDKKRFSLAGLLFIMKKPKDPRSAFGSFNPSPNADGLKTIDCFGKVGSKNGLTHSSPEKKTDLKFQWIAPNTTSAEYELHATLVRDFNQYWADYIHPLRIRVNASAPASSTRLVVSSITFLSGLSIVSLYGFVC